MNIGTKEHSVRLGRALKQIGVELFLVGGYVRNALLALPFTDMDVCAAAPAERLRALESGEFHIAERSYGLGTLMIVQRWKGKTYRYEYTSFRVDNYGRGGAHRPKSVRFTNEIGEDAARRDFTVNALYANVLTGEVSDPLGRGVADAQAGLIRMAAQDTLAEDALRILRMVRLASELGFDIEKDTFAAACAGVRNLEQISYERKRDELYRILLADVKYGRKDAVLRGLHWLKQLGAFRYLLPELLEGDGFCQTPKYHKYDVLEHALHACAAAPPDLTVRMAALLHDVAKPEAYRQYGNLYRHPALGARMAGRALARLKTEKSFARDVCGLVEAHMFDLNNTAQRKSVAKMACMLGPEQFRRLGDLREADFTGSGMGNKAESAKKWRDTLEQLQAERAPFARSDLAVNGNDIQKELGLPPGKKIGTILKALHLIALKKPSQNNYKSLIRYAKIIATGTGDPKTAESRAGKTEENDCV